MLSKLKYLGNEAQIYCNKRNITTIKEKSLIYNELFIFAL